MLAVVLGLLLGGHYAVYRYLVDFLAITEPPVRGAILATLGFLAISFPAAATLVHVRASCFG